SAAARVGSSQGASETADRAILQQLQASLPEDLLDNVTRIVVYETDRNGTIDSRCLSRTPPNGVAGTCNIYPGSILQGTIPADLGTNDDFWNPSARKDRLSGPPDWIGVLVQT